MLPRVSHTVAIDRAFVIDMPELASSLPLEWRYCRGDKTWYTMVAYLEWAVQFFGTKEDALHYWERRMTPPNGQENLMDKVSSVHVDRRVAPKVCKPSVPQDLLQKGEPLHAYEWNELRREFYCRLCAKFATGTHTSSEKHKYRSQWPETYLWQFRPSVLVDRRVAPDVHDTKVCKPCVPPALLQNGEPLHAYEWNDLARLLLKVMCQIRNRNTHIK